MGNMRTFQNTDAAVRFANEIFPLVKKERPDAVFYIVGNDPSKRVRALHDGKNVIVTGRVDSVIPHLAGAAVFVAPMRAVAGVQNKILEALALGTPVVTSSIGAEGLDRRILTVADTPEDFARATLALMANPARRRELAVSARTYLEANCTWEKALANLDAIVEGKPFGRIPAPQSTPA
jgi:glycosyltransferase involved in cell wall biosynthesis